MSFLGSAQLDGGLRHLSSSSSHQTFYPLCVPRLKHSIWPILVLGKSCVRSVGCSFSMKYKMFQNIKKRRDLKSVRTGFSTMLWLSPGLPDNVWNVTEQGQWLQTQQNPPRSGTCALLLAGACLWGMHLSQIHLYFFSIPLAAKAEAERFHCAKVCSGNTR